MDLIPVRVIHACHGSVVIEFPDGAPQGLRSFVLEAARQWVDNQGAALLADEATLYGLQEHCRQELWRLAAQGCLYRDDAGTWVFREPKPTHGPQTCLVT